MKLVKVIASLTIISTCLSGVSLASPAYPQSKDMTETKSICEYLPPWACSGGNEECDGHFCPSSIQKARLED